MTVRFLKRRCDVASVVCDYWTLHILSEVLVGNHRFEDIIRNLPIARNILSNRLADMTRLGILSRSNCSFDRRCVRYAIGPRGASILPIISSLWNWHEWDGARVPIEELQQLMRGSE